MYRIDTKCILLNFLSVFNEVTPELLIEFELKMDSDIYLDISDDSVCFTVERNPKLFVWNGEIVRLAFPLSKGDIEPLKEAVNNFYPESVKNKIAKCLII